MTINREISQFASFVNVNDATKNIGIATTSTPSIGIGTANPSAKFEVVGNTKLQSLNVTGIGTVETLSSPNGTITNLTGTSGTITTLNSTNGTITNLTGTSGTITTLNSTSGTITNLTGTSGTITTFNSTNGTITNGTITNLTGTAGTITTFDSTTGTITNLNSTTGIITNVTVSGLTSTGSLTVTGASVLFLQGLDVTGTAYVDALSVFPGPSTLAGQTNLVNALNVAGVTTLASSGGITTTGGNLYVGDNLYVKNNLISGSISYSGVAATNFTVSETLTARRISIGGTATVGISFTDSNIRIGDVYTGSSITSGTHNNFIGNSAGLSNTTGNYNNFFGRCAGYANTSGTHNNFFGLQAGYCNTTGRYNNFFGLQAGYYNTGCYNNFIGSQAGYANTTGCNNNFIGNEAGYDNTTGCDNNFFGCAAGRCNTTGCNNNFFGRYAGVCNTTGCNNIAIGKHAGTTAFAPSGLINLTTTGNIIAIGNTDITNFYTKMAAKAFANTTVKWDSTTFELAADTSSCRFKTNIRPFLGGVAELLAIESVRYNPIEKPDGLDEVGFIAEQIDEIGLTEFVCYDIEEKPLSVSYDRMAALLVNAIKELDTENTLLKIRLEALETHVGIATNA